jgi:hypothetical protein
VDGQKHSLTAVAVDEVGRQLDALSSTSDNELLAWSKGFPLEPLWALEGCGHVTRALERILGVSGAAGAVLLDARSA